MEAGDMSGDVVTITKKEYLSLVEDSDWLAALEAAGVDGWDGYEHAQDIKENNQ
jgi:hypothetical protein